MDDFVPASGTEPEATRSLYVGTFPDGSQLMVERWLNPDGTERAVTAATRPVADTVVVWGPPIHLDRE